MGVFALAAAGDDGAAFESGGSTVEDEDGLGAEEKELANATKEAKQMSVANHFALVVAHRFDELHHPNAGIDGEGFSGEGFDGDAATNGGE